MGDRNVGKTELLRTYIPEMVNKEIKLPMAIDIVVKKLIINSFKIPLQIWVLGSELNFKIIFPVSTMGHQKEFS